MNKIIIEVPKFKDITIQAKDIHEAEGEWATLEITMPKEKQIVSLMLLKIVKRILEKFPSLQLIIQYLT